MVIGARPQVVKAAVICRALRERGLDPILIDTGQHYDFELSRVFFDELALPRPDHYLEVGSGSHASQTARMLERLEPVLIDCAPEIVVVAGDTNSTLAGALAAAKLNQRVAHVEAGLRSFNVSMPEEINRVVVDHLSHLLFPPTREAVTNLKREGLDQRNMILVGDVMLDAVRQFAPLAAERSSILERLGIASKSFALVTIHRAENTDDDHRFAVIVGALAEIARHIPVVFPVHPRTRQRLPADLDTSGIVLMDPVSYFDMTVLEREAAVVATDSGGVQKEAFFHRTPCVTLRSETEWPELLELGWNRLAPPLDPFDVSAAVLAAVGVEGREAAPYGDGQASVKIAEALSTCVS